MKKFLVFSLMLGLSSPLIIFAETDTPETMDVSPISVTVSYNGSCASNTVISHENAQQGVVEVRQSSMKLAAITRRDALGAAYLLSDKSSRDIAIKAAHDAFLNAQKAADKIAMDASKLENDSFKNSMKNCGAKLPPPTRDQVNNQNGPDNGSQVGPNQDQQGEQQSSPTVSSQNNSRTLRQGMKGEDVKNIQKKLGLKVDGVFGPGTAAKIKEWQAKKGLKQDGILGKESLTKIETESIDRN